ncbi:MAG: LytTR family transcriptional regulator DNA-binding domain-containing protein [Lachnospiraceae bacterium]|nr:LytTR family transcriptional regulator DNA-binding domain-containing protein [Lachnospiraceae bacterium]
MKEAEYITILSNRRKVKIQKDQILYVRSRKKHLEVHVYESTVYMTLMPLRELTKELGEGFIEVQRGCIVAERAIDRIADRIYLVNGEALTYTVRNKKEIVEKLEMIDYSPEIDTYLKVICFPTFPGHCGCILFNIEDIRFTKNSGDAEKALMQYLQNED